MLAPSRRDLLRLRLGKLLFALRTRRTRKAVLHGVGASIEHCKMLETPKFATVIDVGANRGQFALLCRTLYPSARIVSFEPLPRPASIFRSVFSGDASVELHQIALGEAQQRLAMHVAADDDSSSLLTIGQRQAEAFGTREVARIDVDVQRLDRVLAPQRFDRPMLLKIDVQGFEASVLRGAAEFLPAVDALYVESSFVELYEGQSLFADVYEVAIGHGFALRGVFNQQSDRIGVPLQADFLFTRPAVGDWEGGTPAMPGLGALSSLRRPTERRNGSP